MRPSEDFPNARSNLKMNLALLPTSHRAKRLPVCPPFISPIYIRVADPSSTQLPRSPCSDHPSWPPPHGNFTLPTSFRKLRPTPPRSSMSRRQPKRQVKSTRTSAPLRRRSVPYLILGSPIFDRGSLCSQKYKRMSQAAKDAREKELAAYMRTLTPDDIKRENAFRTAQRKAGKSRKANMKDPNAPKKPLSAYFMFLQRIRSDPELVKEVFGDETETTKQSVLAAAKWRSMTDDERKVCGYFPPPLNRCHRPLVYSQRFCSHF